MRTTNDNPIDPLGQLGKAVKQPAAAKPDTMKPFESGTWTPAGSHIANAKSAQQTIAEALAPRKQHERDEQTCDLSDAYTRALLGCI